MLPEHAASALDDRDGMPVHACWVSASREPLTVLPCVRGATASQLCAQVACAAHVEVMRKCRPGLMEYALEAVFLKDCYLLGGCRHAPYTPICASGPNGAVLHYGHAAAPNGGRLSSFSPPSVRVLPPHPSLCVQM